MAKTYQEVEALTHAAAAEITKSPDRWMVFLDTAARMYRYSFQEQMLIHAQRPDATACASYELWQRRFNRVVMRGRKGIALIDTSAQRPKLKYVFDIGAEILQEVCFLFSECQHFVFGFFFASHKVDVRFQRVIALLVKHVFNLLLLCNKTGVKFPFSRFPDA